MFTNISWADYLAGVAILSGIYYSYVGLRYYAAEAGGIISGRRKPQLRATPSTGNIQTNTSGIEDAPPAENYIHTEGDDEFAEVEHLIGRLNKVIADASKKNVVHKEFKNYLRLVLKEYPNIKNSPLRSSVNELIVSECEKYGAVTLTQEEVDLLWDTE